jgi:sugar phosphate isomerase/epimerase
VTFALSTRWNTFRHATGEALVDDIVALGINAIELGYDLTLDLVPGIRKRIDSGAVRVVSVHNYCPVPIGAPRGHPELFPLASPDPTLRARAVDYTRKTITFAHQVGAIAVVVHAGNIKMHHFTPKLVALAESGKLDTNKFEKLKFKLLMQREKRAPAYLDALQRSCEDLLPTLESTGIRMGIENLPTWEALPSPPEMDRILKRFDTPLIAYWHDTGHGQICQNLRLTSAHHWFQKFAPRTAGMHLHDVRGIALDHLMPPSGKIDFSGFRVAQSKRMLYVLEPTPGTPECEIRAAHEYLRKVLTPAAEGDSAT